MNIFCSEAEFGYASWLLPLGIKVTNSITDADILLLPGGVDVNPQYYGEKLGRFTQSPNIERDKREIELFQTFVEHNKHVIGICRGHQLMTVLHGGKLVQHMHHPSIHPLILKDRGLSKWESLSDHHQMGLLTDNLIEGKDYILEAWTVGLSKVYLNQDNIPYNFADGFREPEIIYWNKTKSLSIQGHPEWHSKNDGYVKHCQNLVRKYILHITEEEYSNFDLL